MRHLEGRQLSKTPVCIEFQSFKRAGRQNERFLPAAHARKGEMCCEPHSRSELTMIVPERRLRVVKCVGGGSVWISRLLSL